MPPSSSDDRAFAGPLGTKTKAELVEILQALNQGTIGLKAELEDRLDSYLHDNESTLRSNSRYSGLYVPKRPKRRSPRGSETPTPEDDDSSNATRTIRRVAKDVYDSTLKPISNGSASNIIDDTSDAVEKVSRLGRKGMKKIQEATDIDPRNIELPESPMKSIRNAANQAVDVASQAKDKLAPVVQDGIQQAEKVRQQGLKYWRNQGEKEARNGIKLAQEYLSDPENLVRNMLLVELVYLLFRLTPFYRYDFQFPPSQFSWHASARLIHSIFWWAPEYKAKIPYPDIFVMFRPTSNALVGFGMWLVMTILPPYLLSHLITFLPQPKAKHVSQRQTRSARKQLTPLPYWDPLIFTVIRFVIILFPLTNAAPDLWRNQMESLGSLSGRALFAGLTTAFVVADRLSVAE